MRQWSENTKLHSTLIHFDTTSHAVNRKTLTGPQGVVTSTSAALNSMAVAITARSAQRDQTRIFLATTSSKRRTTQNTLKMKQMWWTQPSPRGALLQVVAYHHVPQLEANNAHTVDDLEGCVRQPKAKRTKCSRDVPPTTYSIRHISRFPRNIEDYEYLTHGGLQDLDALLDRLQKLLLMLCP